MARYLPKLYDEYRRTLKGLLRHHSELQPNFANSVFAAATFNCGPNAVTVEHCDFLNNPHGMCGITSGGSFNHKTGGHIYLKQLKLVIEFPSGASMLIPSGAIDHGNTPIGSGETRCSMTQYTAGGLFRWAAYGYMSSKSLLAMKGGLEKKREFDGEPGMRAGWAISLLSKADELEADRQAVFGKK
jgi:hypothetical protein